MTEQDIRRIVGEALSYATVFGYAESGLAPAFLAGEADIILADLDMDSLSIMELCIAIETETGVSILPDQIGSHETLQKLVGHIMDELG